MNLIIGQWCVRHEECQTNWCNYETGTCAHPTLDEPCNVRAVENACIDGQLKCNANSHRCAPINSKQLAVGSTDECTKTSECAWGFYCNRDLKPDGSRKGQCQLWRREGEWCSVHSECQSDCICVLNTCKRRCNISSDCGLAQLDSGIHFECDRTSRSCQLNDVKFRMAMDTLAVVTIVSFLIMAFMAVLWIYRICVKQRIIGTPSFSPYQLEIASSSTI